MSERTYKLLDGRKLIADRSFIEIQLPNENNSFPIHPKAVLFDVLDFVGSLQQQLAERDRTIAL
ncbi:hypothetical protein, partial [Paenibacillus maysiensis]|uniref:hypothetical protein n=1 Tax=Paenibacillus maysiensis TaxID=1155954 RepID=UPI0012DC173E